MKERANKIVQKTLRFTSQDWERVVVSAKQKQMRPATYVRECALNGEPRIHRGESIISGIEGGVLKELNSIGTNLNQLAKVANKTGFIKQVKIEKYLEDLVEVMKELNKK